MVEQPEAVPASVTLYALQTCGHCKDVKKLLQQRGIRFEVIYIDMLVGDERNDTMRMLKRLNPSISFPTLRVGEKTVVGSRKKKIEAALDAYGF